MYFLKICENPDILRLIYFGSKILDLIFLIVPIGLVVLLSIDILKIVIGANNEKTIKEKHKAIINRIIFALALFFVPTIVTVIMNLLNASNITTDYKICIANANKESIEVFEKIQNEIEVNNNNNNNNNNSNSNNTNESSGNLYQDLASQMVSVATSQLGTKNGANNDNKYGKELGINNQPWCAIFVTWVAKNTNVGTTNLYNDVIKNFSGFASTTENILHFYNQDNLTFYYSEYYGGNYIPKAGDYIFFDKKNEWNKIMTRSDIKAAARHTGMVVEVKNGLVYTIEGNAGTPGEVKKRNYQLNSSDIMGYGSWYNN